MRQDGDVHPVLEVIRDRKLSGSLPLQREDSARLAVVLEGGSSRAAFGGGMALALEELGLLETFDAVYGASAGALNGAWLVCGRTQANIHGWWSQESMRSVIKLHRFVSRGPVVDGARLIDEVYEDVTPMGFDEILHSPVEFHPVGTDTQTGEATDLAPFIHDKASLKAALKATTRLPILSGEPVELGGRRFVDGGIAENVPVHMALNQGATHVLAIRTRPASLDWPTSNTVSRHAVAAWLRRNRAAGATSSWLHRNQRRYHTEQLLSSHPRVLQVTPPPDAPRISMVGRNSDTQEQAVRLGSREMRRVLRETGIMGWERAGASQ